MSLAIAATVAGSLLGLIPRRPLEIVIAVVFAVGAVVVLRGEKDDDDEELKVKGKAPGFWRVAWTGFVVITIAELGDLTGITTAVLAAHYKHDLTAVAIGAVLALWAVGGIAIIGGHSLLRLIPVVWISRVSAAPVHSQILLSPSAVASGCSRRSFPWIIAMSAAARAFIASIRRRRKPPGRRFLFTRRGRRRRSAASSSRPMATTVTTTTSPEPMVMSHHRRAE